MKQLLNIRSQEHGHVILIQGIIGNWPLIPEELKYRLEQIPEDEPIDLRISSTGGDPVASIQMYTMLKNRKAPVNAFIEDYCYSAATMFPAAAKATGGKVVIDALIGRLMVHDPEGTGKGWAREEEHRTMAELLADVKSQMRNIYTEWSGQPENTIKKWMADTTFFDAEGAVEAGFADRAEKMTRMTEEDEDQPRFAAQWDKNKNNFLTKAGRDTSPEDTQTSKKTRNTMNEWMKKLRNAFGLGDDSDEADVYLSAKELKARADTLKAEKDDLETKLETVTAERDELKKKLNDQAEKEEEAEEEELDTTLQAMVDDFQIKASDKDELKKEYADDLAGLKKLQARIPKNALKASGNRTVQKPNGKTRAAVPGGLNETVARDLGIQ